MADASKDQHLHQINPKSFWAIPLMDLPKGNWKITIKWINNNKEYLEEITEGLSDEERKKKYEEYKDWCLNTTLSGA